MKKIFVFTREWREYADRKSLDDLWSLYDTCIHLLYDRIRNVEYCDVIKVRDYLRNEIRTRP